MEKTIKVLALVNNYLLISEIEEVAAVDIGQPDCKLTNACIIVTESGQTVLEPFLNNVTRDSAIMMGSDKILTIVEPTPTLLEKYQDLLAPPPVITPLEE